MLTIDLEALVENWRALDRASGAGTETAAVLKADAYGLGAARVAQALARAGVRRFFVAIAEEGATLRRVLGEGPEILVLGGHMAEDVNLIREAGLVPMLNSPDQVARHLGALPQGPFGVQLDTGMNRLGMEPAEWRGLAPDLLSRGPRLIMSHLHSADEPDSPANAAQLALFHSLTDGCGVRRSLANTGGVLLGPAYHFDLTRPGIGTYGGLPFAGARPVVHLSLPVIQTRTVLTGEIVGYNATWTATQDTRLATVAAGYADGLLRALSGRGTLYCDGIACPIVGRVSMDLITADISALGHDPAHLDILCPEQGVDALATAAGTIGYEILTSLGARHARRWLGAA